VSGPGGEETGRVGASGLWAAIDAYRDVMLGASVADLVGAGSAAYYLRAMALESTIAEQMRVRVTVSIHQALAAGACLSEVAEATGLDTAQVARRWSAWAQGQRQLWADTGRFGLDEDVYARVMAVVETVGRLDDGVGDTSWSVPTPLGGK
jgi:hypothetical protein